jgi:hypothetical protein
MALSAKLRYAALAVALAATGGSVYWANGLPQGEEADSALVAPAQERRARQRAASVPAEQGEPLAGDLDLQRLQREPGTDPSADLFGPRDFAPAPPVRKPNAQQAAAVPVEDLPPPPPPPPPPVPFSYIGRLAEGAQTTVFLAAGDRNLVVKAGDVIDNTYRVEEIGQSALVLTYLPSNVRQTMPIGAPQ